MPIFSSSAELVVAHVTVKDRQGAYVTSLPQEAFRVFEDGTPQRIDFFTGEDSPVTVGFLVDSSGSMREGRERVIAAATAFAEASNRQDELFALAFNEHVRAALPPSAPFTNDATVFRAALAGAWGAQGRTAMYDAISNGLSNVAKGRHPRRALVVVGDGGDNASTTTFDEVLKQDELWVLDSSPSAGLTLITCYPFDYVGPAPRRFIVHAERMANVSERSHTTDTREDDTR
jgi:Ca-activated chloride channel homolog